MSAREAAGPLFRRLEGDGAMEEEGPFAASKVAEAVAEVLKKMNIERAQVFVKGIGSGRDSAVRSLAARGIDIVSIKDITPVPHNGCRPRKVRRV